MFDLQPTLQNEFVRIEPLQSTDFERLYAVASDPLLWEQHPERERYKREVFETFFSGAIESGGAFLVYNNTNNEVIGSSRFYDLFPEQQSVAIGYTFISRACWGKPYNRALKELMLDHAFRFVENVIFHVGISNFRSQKAVEKLGAQKLNAAEMQCYNGTPSVIYRLPKDEWNKWKATT